jgi:hypothetical protein
MASGHWVVMATRAFEIWEIRHRPNADEVGVVPNWLADREAQGPPEDAVADDKGNWTHRAGGREFDFRRFDLVGQDPAGYLLIMQIR